MIIIKFAETLKTTRDVKVKKKKKSKVHLYTLHAKYTLFHVCPSKNYKSVGFDHFDGSSVSIETDFDHRTDSKMVTWCQTSVRGNFDFLRFETLSLDDKRDFAKTRKGGRNFWPV